MTTSKVPFWVYASIVLTALLSLLSLSYRYRVESRNKAVGIVADWDTVEAISKGSGLTPEAGLGKLKAAGVNGLVVGETTLLEVAGSSAWMTREEPLFRAQRAARLRFPGKKDFAVNELEGLPMGLEQEAVFAASKADLPVVARLQNPLGVSDDYVRGMIGWIKEEGAAYFLPVGEQVLGRRDSLKTLDEALLKNNILYCAPEFAKIGGDQTMIEMSPGNVVRLHAAQAQELDKLSEAGAVERYVKAVVERNQRMVLVRPISSASPNPIESFVLLVGKIRRGIEREGYELGQPHAFGESSVPKALFIAISLAMAPALFWLGMQFIGGRHLRILGGALLVLLAFACAKEQGRQIAALSAATLFPLLAFVCLDIWRQKSKSAPLLFLGVSVVSLTGGLVVGGLLNGLPYFVRADTFMGVKLAHFLPIGLIGTFFFCRLTNAKEMLRSPILWSQAALSIVILVGFAFMASRTGNDNPAGVSGPELAFRSLLENILIVRPRTKEIMLGHPAMMLGLAILVGAGFSERFRNWSVLLLMLGAIGQTSMVNTMCHLHTPLTVSFARIGVGWIVGGIIGLVGWGTLSRLMAKRET